VGRPHTAVRMDDRVLAATGSGPTRQGARCTEHNLASMALDRPGCMPSQTTTKREDKGDAVVDVRVLCTLLFCVGAGSPLAARVPTKAEREGHMGDAVAHVAVHACCSAFVCVGAGSPHAAKRPMRPSTAPSSVARRADNCAGASSVVRRAVPHLWSDVLCSPVVRRADNCAGASSVVRRAVPHLWSDVQTIGRAGACTSIRAS